MQGIVNGLIYENHQFVENKVLLFNEKIEAIVDTNQVNRGQLERVIDAKGRYVLPGFIDVHMHGYASHDTMDASDVALRTISQLILENGVTSFLPTTMTMERAHIENTLTKIRALKDAHMRGATLLGVHLEGPFINAHYKGAQNGAYVALPDVQFVEDFIDLIKIVTIAPETEGAMDFIKVLSNKGIVCSLGHTGADYETAVQAFEHGASGITHTFNAMTALHHRNPGVVGAALNKDFYCEVIADNIHLHQAIYELLLKIKKPERILLVTDCVRATGMPDGDYELGGQKVHLEKGKCSLEGGTLAGSTLKLNDALKNFVESTPMKLEDAVLTVTENPATYIGEFHHRGSLCQGKLADITIMDNRFVIHQTFVEGSLLYQSQV